jgi:hypothetical protein
LAGPSSLGMTAAFTVQMPSSIDSDLERNLGFLLDVLHFSSRGRALGRRQTSSGPNFPSNHQGRKGGILSRCVACLAANAIALHNSFGTSPNHSTSSLLAS